MEHTGIVILAAIVTIVVLIVISILAFRKNQKTIEADAAKVKAAAQALSAGAQEAAKHATKVWTLTDQY